MNPNDHSIKYLIDALTKVGIIKYKNYRTARTVVQGWIKSGKLKLRVSRRNNYYLVNDDEVKEIINRFTENI